jgi:hypothetical protein
MISSNILLCLSLYCLLHNVRDTPLFFSEACDVIQLVCLKPEQVTNFVLMFKAKIYVRGATKFNYAAFFTQSVFFVVYLTTNSAARIVKRLYKLY